MIRRWIYNLGDVGLTLSYAGRSLCRGRLDWGEVLSQIDRSGIGSLPIVAISASFIGMAVSVQFAQEIVVRFGADNLVGSFVALAMLRELAPVFVAVVLSGSIGAAITAEIGTMKVTEQIDALEVFHINPVEYLILPRLVSTMVLGPVLTIYGAFLAILSGQLFTEWMVNVPGAVFWNSVRSGLTLQEVEVMMTKSMAFSVAIAVISVLNGLATQGGSQAVGIRTTKTVIWCFLTIFVLNYLITSMFFQV